MKIKASINRKNLAAFAIIAFAIVSISLQSCASSNKSCDAYQSVELEQE